MCRGSSANLLEFQYRPAVLNSQLVSRRYLLENVSLSGNGLEPKQGRVRWRTGRAAEMAETVVSTQTHGCVLTRLVRIMRLREVRGPPHVREKYAWIWCNHGARRRRRGLRTKLLERIGAQDIALHHGKGAAFRQQPRKMPAEQVRKLIAEKSMFADVYARAITQPVVESPKSLHYGKVRPKGVANIRTLRRRCNNGAIVEARCYCKTRRK